MKWNDRNIIPFFYFKVFVVQILMEETHSNIFNSFLLPIFLARLIQSSPESTFP